MASSQAQGGAPVTFLDTTTGIQHVIPLALISFTSTTTANASAWLNGFSPSVSPELSPLVASTLQSLVGQGLLTASVLPASPPAFTLTARDGGKENNGLSVTIANVNPNAVPSETTADVTVKVTQTWSGLTLSGATGIAAVLGTQAGGTAPVGSTAPGTSPGLAYVSDVGTLLPTATTTPAEFTGTPPELAVAASTGSAFTLVATHLEADASLLHASISGVANNAFTLTLTWTKAATGVTLSSLQTLFGYVLNVTAPVGGFAYPPAAKTYTLAGGADPSGVAAATAAQAIVIAG